jgi:GT2 family glycosyltransferase
MKKISASLVLYNTSVDQIKRVLDSLEASELIEVLYVIDNSPKDSLRDLFDANWIKYSFTGSNPGYGTSHNVAMRQAIDHFDYHLVLNPDIYFDSGELRKAIMRMNQDVRIGHLMPKILNADSSIQYLCKLLPTPLDLIVRRFPLWPIACFFSKRGAQYELRFSGYENEMNVPNLSGCFMLLRTSALKVVGLFDERFFMYGEDVDLTRRIHKKFITLYYPDATVTHSHARDSYKSLKMLWIHSVNLSRYFNKWGWFFDRGRTQINRELLNQLSSGVGKRY